MNRNQYRPDVCAIAAPILDEDGTPLAAVAVCMPDSRYEAARLPEWGRLGGGGGGRDRVQAPGQVAGGDGGPA